MNYKEFASAILERLVKLRSQIVLFQIRNDQNYSAQTIITKLPRSQAFQMIADYYLLEQDKEPWFGGRQMCNVSEKTLQIIFSQVAELRSNGGIHSDPPVYVFKPFDGGEGKKWLLLSTSQDGKNFAKPVLYVRNNSETVEFSSPKLLKKLREWHQEAIRSISKEKEKRINASVS